MGGGEQGAWLRPRGFWGHCPLLPAHVGHPFSEGLACTPEGALGPRSGQWGPLPESLSSLKHVLPLKSSLASPASSTAGWSLPHLLPT